MSKNLVIVESPAKSKTLKKYLGKDYEILASYGHVRDLLPKTGAVDPENDFAMRYEIIEKNAKHMDAIAKALKSAETLYLATDPDREGEAISWHIHEILKAKRGLLKDKKVHRVVFHEITQTAVKEAIAHPRDLSMDLVNAQQARRALDYLVGFNLSPLLWKKIRRGLSAGRVQSPALRLIVEREEEIEKFKAEEYWTIKALAETEKSENVSAKLIQLDNKKLTQFSINNADLAEQAKTTLLKASKNKLTVTKVEKKQRKKQPTAPFTTSTLQQAAINKLGFTAQRTMRTAQQLYEGMDVGQGSTGLITYMRTDAVYLAQEALTEIRRFITERFGKDNLPDSPRMYRAKAKNAQEAHEAIRPTSVYRTPEQVKDYLSPEQFKLYELIWKRTVACQMLHATIDTVSVDLGCGEKNTQHLFRASGSTIIHPGFMNVYLDDDDDKAENLLPILKEGELVNLREILPEQHFTEPPPRYSEASLVKTLEEFGIGRPSTYASIISTLLHREYATLEQKRFHPTDVGRIVNNFLTQYFTQYVDYDFTAKLEDALDEVSRGEKMWVPLLKEFWSPFIKLVEKIEETVKRKDVTQEALDEDCPKCGKKLSIRLGKRGRFIGCTAYPDCDYTRSMDGEETTSSTPEVVADRKCSDCGSDLVIKFGRYGKFIGCSNYPKCKHIEPLEKPADTGIECPQCHKGSLLKRKSRFQKIFYSCSTYPDCNYAVWNEPINKKCPKCSWPILTIKITKRRGTEEVCPQKECGHAEQIAPPESKE